MNFCLTFIHKINILDQTLPINSQVTSGCTICQINGGTVRGVNLFHSFQQFSIPIGGQALFNNDTSIQNIFTRVTGNSISNINGLIQTNGSANLFLLNPNGIIWGKNAQLNIAGSFLATTASSFKFADGSEFSAVNPQTPPLLTVNITPGLQYGQSPTGATIVNRGNLTAGQDLTLVADQLDLQGQLQAGRDLTLQAQHTVQIRDTDSAFIATAQRDLTIQGNQSIDIATLNPASGLTTGRDMLFIAPVRLLGNINLTTGGYLTTESLDGTVIDFINPHQQVIKVDGDVSLGDYTGSSLYILASGQVQLGNVSINPDGNGNYDLGSVTQSISDGRGGSQTVTVTARNDLGILDVRAGIDPQKLPPGLLDNSSSVTGANPIFSHQGNPTNANITIGQLDSNGNFVGNDITNSGGSVVLTNQYRPSSRLQKISGNIQAGNIDTSIVETGVNGGDINLVASGDIATQSLTSYSVDGSANNGGAITLIAGGNISTQLVTSSSFSEFGNVGNGGAITLLARKNISIQDIFTSSFANGGNGGSVTIQSGSDISLTNITTDSTSGSANGNAGDITLIAPGNILIAPGNISVPLENINLTANKIAGNGNSGNINIQAGNEIVFDGNQIQSILYPQAVGNGGNINISTGSLSLINGSQLSTSSYGQGNAGNINIQATGNVSLDGTDASNQYISGAYSTVAPGAVGNGGSINITTNSLAITHGALLGAGTYGQGNAGNINIQAAEQVSLDGTDPSDQYASGIYTEIRPGAVGNGGNINVTTKSLSITNGALLSNRSFAPGNLGSINIQAEQVSLDGTDMSGKYLSGVYSTTSQTISSGVSNLTTNSPLLTDGLLLNTSVYGVNDSSGINYGQGNTSGQGNANSTNSIVVPVVMSNGGNINITTKSLAITDGALVGAGTYGEGNAGNINIQATEQVSLDGTDPSDQYASGVYSEVRPGAVGDGGNVNITTNLLSITRGGELSTSTYGQGKAGNINIIATGQAVVDGVSSSSSPSSISSTATTAEIGGNIDITTKQLNITDQGKVSVSSPDGEAGNLSITADNILLNQGELTAQTGNGNSGNNANIRLFIADLLLMRNQSLISAQAFNTAIGGNITINAPNGFVVAVPSENSDINANASYGNGGKVEITTQAIFGTEYRLFNTPESDITASSQFGLNGQVVINQLNIDPSKGLQTFPTTILDTNNQLSQHCSGGGKLASRKNQFTVTGKGGLSSSPADLLTGINHGVNPLVNLVEPLSSQPNHRDGQVIHSNNVLPPDRIIEAQGWIVNAQGEVELVADRINAISHNPVIFQVYCSHS